MTAVLWLAFLPARASYAAGLAVCWVAYVLSKKTGLLDVPTCGGCGLAADCHADNCTAATDKGEVA